jgi:hypothetical protein
MTGRDPMYARSGGSGAPAGPLPPPAGLRPMHPMAARELPADQAGWTFEPTWGGCRALGHVVAGGLASQPQRGRHGRLVPRAGRAAGALGDHAAVLDGEVVAVGPEGRPSFEASSSAWPPGAGRRRGAAVTYLAFDLLWLDGRLLEGLALAGDAWRTVAVVPRRGRRPAGRDPRPGAGGGGGQAAAQPVSARQADSELAQGQALSARDVPGRRVRPRRDQARSLLVGLADQSRAGCATLPTAASADTVGSPDRRGGTA